MRVYKNIKLVNSKSTGSKNQVIFSQKKLRKLSFIFVCILSLGIMGFSLSSSGLSSEVKNITSSWSPNISDLGKLKFVYQDSLETDQEVFLQMEDMSMPFENTYAQEVDAGVFLVNGLGGVVVKACLAGKVTKIENNGNQKSVYVAHGKSLVSVYELLDNVGVKEGDGVEKNTPLGISMSSVVQFKILYKDKILTGLTVKDGELTFM